MNEKEVAALFEQLIKMSYGEKSPDGKRFIKSEELTEAFCQTEAYTELLLELMGDDSATAVAEFIKGVMPLDGIPDSEIDAAMKEATEKIAASYE